MVRELPKVTIGGEQFYVNLRLDEFRQVNNPHNAISFNDVEHNDDHLLVLYDHHSKNAFQGTEHDLQSRNDVEFVKLKPFKELDPVGWNRLINEHRNRHRL